MRITILHHKACRGMSNGDPEGQIFLSHPHINNGFFFLLTIHFPKRIRKVPEYGKMPCNMMKSQCHLSRTGIF